MTSTLFDESLNEYDQDDKLEMLAQQHRALLDYMIDLDEINIIQNRLLRNRIFILELIIFVELVLTIGFYGLGKYI